MNRKQFIEWVQSIDEDIEFDDLSDDNMFIAPNFDSVWLDRDTVIKVDTPEQFQFVALYLHEFRCGWKYKNTTIWREGDVWGADHQWIINGLPQVYHIRLLEFNSDAEMVNFIIMLNDGHLPTEEPDDLPILPKNPFLNAKYLFENSPNVFYDFDPKQYNSLEQWVNVVISFGDDILGIQSDFEASDWQAAQDEAWDEIYYWFWGHRKQEG